MAGVTDGQAVSAAVTNAAYLYKNGDDTAGGNIAFASTKGIVGTTTNDNASTGNVGYNLIQSRLRSAATSITTDTSANVTATKLTLPAGDWMIAAGLGIVPAGTTQVATIRAAISKTSATLPGTDIRLVPTSGEFVTVTSGPTGITQGDSSVIIPPFRASIAISTDFYLVANVSFSASTCTAFGSLWAWRVR